ncbi:unnamed protein product [Dimorphilus gyrociliatus]|uniref:NACHT domain-containing protein n=1 Tax=Dimorphilus gyrociliatus TaxID=2664684 RepID=A0A7I8W1C2_9ANNE|nr:unnamed protein product [Dimorphilus gyrociliatus]
MLSRERLSFNYYKEKLIDLLADSLINDIFSNELIDKNNCTENITIKDLQFENNDKDIEKKIQLLMKILGNQSLCAIVSILEKIHRETEEERVGKLIDNFQNTNKVWNKLIEDTKSQRRDDFYYLCPLPFDNSIPINLSTIVTPIEISKVVDFNFQQYSFLSTKIEYEHFYQIFTNGFTKAIVQAEAGMGKTVQFRYLIHTWSHNVWKVSSDKLLIFISLKDASSTENVFDIILKQNFQNISYVTRNVIQSIFAEKNQDIILLIDGVGEYSYEDPFLKRIIEELNPPVPTVIWSRKLKVNSIQANRDMIFELKGFNKEQRISFSEKFFKGNKQFVNYANKLTDDANLLSMCRIPLMLAITFHAIKERGDSFLEESSFNIYKNIIEAAQTCINYQGIAEKMKIVHKLSFMFLAKGKILLLQELDDGDEKGLIDILRGFAYRIQGHQTDLGINEIHFYHSSIQEFFASNYLLEEFQKLLKRLYWTVSFDNQLVEIDDKSLYRVIEFIGQDSIKVLKRVVQSSKKIQAIYEYSENVKHLLDIGFVREKKRLHLEKLKLNDVIISALIRKVGWNISEIFLLRSEFNLELVMELLSLHSPNLKILCLSNKNPPKHFYSDEHFLKNLINLITNANLKYFHLGQIGFIIKRRYINTNCKTNLCIQELKMWEEQHEDHIIVDVTFGPTLMISLIDECANFSNYINYHYEYLLKECRYLENLTLKNKTLKESLSRDFIDFLKVMKSDNSLKTFSMKDLTVEFPNEEYLWSSLKQKNPPKFQWNRLDENQNGCQCPRIDVIVSKKHCSALLSRIDETFVEQIVDKNMELGLGYVTISFGLTQHTHLFRSFNFLGYDLIESQAKILGRVLGQCSHIESLVLDGNKYMGCGFMNICKGLKTSCKSLKTLSFNDCNLSEHQGASLGETLRCCCTIESLSMNQNGDIKMGFIPIFNGLENSCQFLKSLNFNNCFLTKKLILQNLVRVLYFCSNLESVLLGNNQLKGDSLKSLINELKNSSLSLKCLDLGWSDIEGVQAKCLGDLLLECSQLESLHLIGCKNMSFGAFNDICDGLKKLSSSIQLIDLSSCSITENQVKCLGNTLSHLTNLQTLSLSDNDNLGDGLKVLIDGLKNSHHTLKDLELSNCCIREYQVDSLIESLPGKINFESPKDVDIVHKLFNFEKTGSFPLWSINKLNLDNCSLTRNQGKRLKEVLKFCENLQSFSMYGNRNIETGIEDILAGLEHSSQHLKSLDFGNCNLTENQGKLLGEFFQLCSNLESIFLNENDNIGSGFNYICYGLKSSSKCLKLLHVGFCELLEIQNKCLAELLQSCSNLEAIFMDDTTKIGYAFQMICQGLIKSSINLKEISFRGCDLTQSQARYLADTLQLCPNLEYITVGHNKRMGNGIIFICDSLNTSSRYPKIIEFEWFDFNESQAREFELNLKICLNCEPIFIYRGYSYGRDNEKVNNDRQLANSLKDIPVDLRGTVCLEIPQLFLDY